jgi:hypothetical protein
MNMPRSSAWRRSETLRKCIRGRGARTHDARPADTVFLAVRTILCTKSDLRVVSSNVSRDHAEIALTGDGYVVQDGSRAAAASSTAMA